MRQDKSTHTQRLVGLHIALLQALEAPSAQHVRAVGEALMSIEFSDDLDDDEATAVSNDALHLRCDELTRRLLDELGPLAPLWLRRYIEGPPPSVQDGDDAGDEKAPLPCVTLRAPAPPPENPTLDDFERYLDEMARYEAKCERIDRGRKIH